MISEVIVRPCVTGLEWPGNNCNKTDAKQKSFHKNRTSWLMHCRDKRSWAQDLHVPFACSIDNAALCLQLCKPSGRSLLSERLVGHYGTTWTRATQHISLISLCNVLSDRQCSHQIHKFSPCDISSWNFLPCEWTKVEYVYASYSDSFKYLVEMRENSICLITILISGLANITVQWPWLCLACFYQL